MLYYKSASAKELSFARKATVVRFGAISFFPDRLLTSTHMICPGKTKIGICFATSEGDVILVFLVILEVFCVTA